MDKHGKNFALGRMLQIGKDRVPGRVAYLYRLGDDSIRWTLEEWQVLADGNWRVLRWDFFPDRAVRGDYVFRGGIADFREYQAPLDITAPDVIVASELAWTMFATGTPNLEPFPHYGH